MTTSTVNPAYNAALTLPPEPREELIELLLTSLEFHYDPAVHAANLEEVHRHYPAIRPISSAALPRA